MDQAVDYLIDLDQSGRGWEKKIYTMNLNMVDLAPFHGLDSRVSAVVRQRLAGVRQDLLEGRIQVPTTYATIGRPSQEKSR
jgi:hypothetical protein